MSAYIFYGKAGSGKGTQAKLLKDHLESLGKKVIYIETGGLFRDFVSQNKESFTAKRTGEIIDNGQLMPAFFPIYMWSNVLVNNFTGNEDVILDGASRRIEETEVLALALDFYQIKNKFVFEIDISDDTAIARLKIRAGNRPDDASTEKIQTRLDWYRTNVVPVVEYFKNDSQFKFSIIDGEKTVPEVFMQIKNSIE
jgi:adenylate kinase family enzyme